MAAARDFATHLLGVLSDTGRVWWGVLPRLLWLVLLGQLSLETSQRVAAVVSVRNAWVSLVVYAVGIVGALVTQILCLRAVGDALGIRDVVAVEDDRDTSITRLLAVTLLPFLGIWSTFGGMEEQLAAMHTLVQMRYGPDAGADLLRVLDPWVPGRFLLVVGVVLGAYVVRRSLDLAHEHTGVRALGIAAGLVEGFFMLSSIVALTYLVGELARRLERTRLAMWTERWSDGLRSLVPFDLGGLDAVVGWVRDVGWPLLAQVALQPMLWVGLALLVFGRELTTGAALVHAERAPVRGRLGRRAVIEAQEAFFGDLDDRWLPMWEAARMVLRTGLELLAVLVVTFTTWSLAGQWLQRGLVAILGGHDAWWWESARPLLHTVVALVVVPVQLCLVGAVAARLLRSEAPSAPGAAAVPGRVAEVTS